jgi:hypothetical protein
MRPLRLVITPYTLPRTSAEHYLVNDRLRPIKVDSYWMFGYGRYTLQASASVTNPIIHSDMRLELQISRMMSQEPSGFVLIEQVMRSLHLEYVKTHTHLVIENFFVEFEAFDEVG